MSNATILQTNRDIFIGSDSAISSKVDGKLFRVGDNATKLFHIDDYLIFMSGDLNFCYNTIHEFKNSSNRDVESLTNIIKSRYKNEKIDVVLCEFVNGGTRVHQISPYNGFEDIIYENIPDNSVNVLTAGVKTIESYDISCKLLSEGKPVRDIFSEVFRSISYEGVGGELTVYRVNENGINVFMREKIVEKEDLNILDFKTFKKQLKKHMIVGEYIYGKVFMGVNLAIEDENGILKFQGSKGEIFDRDGTLVMKLGLVDENSMCGEAFGMWAFNDITRVKIDDCEGFVIDRANPSELDGWEKVLWANTDGTLYAHDLVASSLKIVHEKDWSKEILNAETGYFDVGWFQNIVKDGKLTTDEKYQLITELHRIYSGYKLLLSQADKYQRVHRDNIVNWNGQFNTSTQSFPTTPSDIDRYSTIPLTNAYIELMEYMKSYIGITSVNPHDPLTINSEDPINEITQEVLPDRATFILKFKNYYDEADKLRNAIEDAIVYQGISMGTNYNNVYMSDYGFIAVRNDGRYRAFLNATNGLALQKWENGMWTNKLFATLGDPMWEDGTLYAEGLVTHNLRIVRANMSDAITFDWYDGITIYGENGEEIRLNANEAISIWTNNDKKFWVGTDGRLYAKDITTHGLKIVDGELGERIILDQENGITINGFSGEQIRLNANEGIAITVNGEKRFWIGNDGLLYAKKLIITEEYDTGIFDYVSGSYISDLTVNKLRTLNDSSPADHVWIADNFIKILTGGANDTAQEKFTLMTTDGGKNIYSAYGAGDQYGNDRGYITKDSDYFIFKYTGMDGQDRKLSMRDSEVDSILLETPHRMRLRGEKLIRIEVDSSNYIEISPNGVKIVGSRIDLN